MSHNATAMFLFENFQHKEHISGVYDNSFDENTCHRLDQVNNANSAGGDGGDKYELRVWDIYDSL